MTLGRFMIGFMIGWNASAGATGDRSINSRGMHKYMRTYVRMEYKPGFIAS